MKKILLSEKYRKFPKRFVVDKYIRDVDSPIPNSSSARKNYLVPLVIADYGSMLARFKQVKHIRKTLFGALSEMAKGARSILQNPYRGKKTIDSAFLKELESYAHTLGVTDIGYTPVNPDYIFQDYQILFPNAIVFSMEMDKQKMHLAPSLPSFVEIFRTYYQLGVVVNKVAAFLRDHGYNAHPSPAICGDVNYVPVAIDAGLGKSGKSGLLITPNNGPRVRLAAVFTDIENLPFAEENPHGWVRDYCETCNNCIQKCPADAIFPETRSHEDGGPIFIDHTKCAGPFSNDNGCSLCIKYCPFSYADYETLKNKFMQMEPV